LNTTDRGAQQEAGGLCDGYDKDLITTMQNYWDQSCMTVDIDELSEMALELFKRRIEAFAPEEDAEVTTADVNVEMVHDHYAGFHAAGSGQVLKASLKLAAAYHMVNALRAFNHPVTDTHRRR